MERRESTGAVADAAREVRGRIDLACRRSGREPESVRLIAVTKSVPLDAIRRAATAGVADFAENHAKDLAVKAPEVASTWHSTTLGIVRARPPKTSGPSSVTFGRCPGSR